MYIQERKNMIKLCKINKEWTTLFIMTFAFYEEIKRVFGIHFTKYLNGKQKPMNQELN